MKRKCSYTLHSMNFVTGSTLERSIEKQPIKLSILRRSFGDWADEHILKQGIEATQPKTCGSSPQYLSMTFSSFQFCLHRTK